MLRSRLVAATAGAAVFAGLVGAPSATAEDTPVTFTVEAGTLSIAYDGAEGGALGNVTSVVGGATVSGTLGTLKVTDNRASIAGWSVQATMAGPFTSGVNEIPCTNATVTISGVSNDAGVTATNLAAAGLPLLDANVDGSCADGTDGATLMTAVTTGSNTASFTSSLAVTIPADAPAGTYSGTLTQTVS